MGGPAGDRDAPARERLEDGAERLFGSGARFDDDAVLVRLERFEGGELGGEELGGREVALALERALPSWRRVVADAVLRGVPAPVFASELADIDALRADRLPAALIQGQRDFFGAHSYRRVDDPGTAYHVLWAEAGRPEIRTS